MTQSSYEQVQHATRNTERAAENGGRPAVEIARATVALACRHHGQRTSNRFIQARAARIGLTISTFAGIDEKVERFPILKMSPVPKQNLFTDAPSTDLGYSNTRAAKNKRAEACRANCEALWERFEPYADPEFVKEFGSAFDARYWEMYLTIALKELGFELTCPKPGPDVGIEFEGRRIWFEATSPDRGKDGTPDQVPLLPDGGNVAYDVPNEKMILRYLNSISSKKAQHENWIAKGIVSKDDAFIVALNPRGLSHDYADTVPPRILQAAFAVGNQYITIARDTLKQVGGGFQFRDQINKASGTQVSTAVFQQVEYACLSGLLVSRVDVANQPEKLGNDFQLVPNPHAAVALPEKFRLRGTYFKVERKGDGYDVTAV